MTEKQWLAIQTFRNEFKAQVEKWSENKTLLQNLQKVAADKDGVPPYNLELPVVYNKKLDELTQDDDIRLIVIGDNPGKDEQLFKNSSYLVGQAGKIAEGYFKKNPELGIDFRKNVIILNKTPIHSAKTAELKKIAKDGGNQILNLLVESQEWMAKKTAELLHALLVHSDGQKCELWLVGYSEVKPKGIFAQYREELKKSCLEQGDGTWNQVFVYQHFSMNRFTIDLRERIQDGSIKAGDLKNQLMELGRIHKTEIFGQD